MAQTKLKRIKKKQLGQFMTPLKKCEEILHKYKFTILDKILEPSFGCGNFVITLIDIFLPLYSGSMEDKITKILNNNIWGVELDKKLYQETLDTIRTKYGVLLEGTHNLVNFDYLMYIFAFDFDYIIGNPPFGGSINPEFDVELEKKFGIRDKIKIKKETYSFFMIKSVENLKKNGKLIFISSDTFLTIKTMIGLRKFLYKNGSNHIEHLKYFSEETNYPMVILTHHKSNNKKYITLNDTKIEYDNMILTDNFSWYIPDEYVKYFKCDKLSKYVKGTSGMTIGKNHLFLRKIKDNAIEEPYNFTFFDDPITLEKEFGKARLNKMGDKKIKDVKRKEENCESKRNVKIELKETPEIITLPNSDYCLYNKSTNEILYSKPSTTIFWKDDGDACITFKKNGNWYLHGVGGLPFFKKEGLTWQLISSSIKARYLPGGYILDSGSPIAILNDGIKKRELFFIIGWLLTDKATELLKQVINHTKNIQSKDIERLPYPSWVSDDYKKEAIKYIQENIKKMYKSENLDTNFKSKLNTLYKY